MRFGDEPEAFVQFIDVLIRVEGGIQSRRETLWFKTFREGVGETPLLYEYEVE